MKTLMPILVFSLLFAYLSDKRSVYRLDELNGKVYLYKEKMFYTFLVIGMATFVGLRTRGNDTYTYRIMYESITPGIKGIENITWTKLASAPGLQFVCIILRTIGATTQDYFMIFAFVTVSIYLWFIRKYTSNIWFSVYFFITMGVYTFTMAAIKQTVAVAFLLVATDRAIDRKWIRFIFWVLVAEMFHPYAFIYLIAPFLFFSPWSSKMYLVLGGTVLIAFFLSRFMSGILIMLDNMGANYSADEFSGEGVNIFRVLVVWVTVIISFVARNFFKNSNNRVTNLIINASMINAVIMFIGLFGTANYFARLANYFLIFQCLALPLLFRFFTDRSKKFVSIMSVVGYWIYFYYDMVLATGAFDNDYAFIKIFTFIKQHF